MATANGIRAGRAFVELFADDSKLARGLKNAQKKLEAFGSGIRHIGTRMMAAGGAVTAPLVAAAKAWADAGANLALMSARTGIGVEALSALSYAAEVTGTSLEDMETGLRKM